MREAAAPRSDGGKRPKILFVIGSLDVGGAETQLVELASRLDRSSFDVVVCTLTAGGPLESTLCGRGIRLLSLGMARRGSRRGQSLWTAVKAPLAAVRLWRIVRRERPDIVHGVLISAYLLATFAARLARVRLVVSGRRSLGRFKEHKTFYLWLERVADRMTDLFIANSEAVRQDTLAREPIAPSDIIVIQNGVDFDRLDRAARAADDGHRTPDGSPCVLVVSNFIQYKGHEYFLRAWADVLPAFPGAVALLAGDGALRDRLEALAETLGIRHAVRFLGIRHDVPALLAQADLFVHPSLEEGYSNAVLEAMAAGVPVVACAVGGNVEAITDQVTGLLVPPADSRALAEAMRRLLNDRTAARELGARGRVSVRARHDLDTVVRQYEAVYRRLLACTGHAAPGVALDEGEELNRDRAISRCAE